MSYPAWQAAIRTWIETATTLPTIYADQDAPRPVPPYADVRFLADQRIGQGRPVRRHELNDEDELERTTEEIREGTFSVGLFGDGHANKADDLALSLDDDETRDTLGAALVVIVSEESRITAGMTSSKAVESRTFIDFRYRRTATRTRTITNTIEHTASQLQFVDQSGDPIGTPIDITLPPED